MTGLYVHIPFCDKACHYCDFHFSTTFSSYREDLISCLLQELKLRESEIEGNVSSIYFGGGTPSVMTIEEWKVFFQYFKSQGFLATAEEVTVEVNPDHLHAEYLQALKEFGVNRLSIGVQSFFDEVLEKMNRSHDRDKALKGLKTAKEIGFDNITLDLIYGVPFQSDEQLKKNLEIVKSLDIPHISAYQLTIEDNTVFGRWKKQGKLLELSDENCLNQFKTVRNSLKEMGYEHYEVSNFAKPGSQAVHNSSYWKQVKYIGIGPGAHSYNGSDRLWNVANNKKYIKSIQASELPFEKEELYAKDQFNEAILLGLRQLNQGIKTSELEEKFPSLWNEVRMEINNFIQKGELIKDGEFLRLSEEGIFIIDYISSELFVV